MAKRANRDTKKKEIRYLNFPVQLLQGFFIDTESVLDRAFKYSLYYHTLKLEHGEYEEKFLSSLNYYGFTFKNPYAAMNEAEDIYKSIHLEHGYKCPMVGLNIEIFIRYNNQERSEFDKVCLLGFLAIKSILQNKPYCKITNNYWLSRMDGEARSIDNISQLSDEIRKYANEYQTKKIKAALEDDWNLVTYARYTRGFYVSFKLDKEGLIYQAELRRKSTKEKQRKFEEKSILQRVLNRINNETENE